MNEAERLHRARRRQFIRAHHPDRGGDPATFIVGLEHLDRFGSGERDAGRVRVVIARRSILVRIWRALRGRHDPPRVR